MNEGTNQKNEQRKACTLYPDCDLFWFGSGVVQRLNEDSLVKIDGLPILNAISDERIEILASLNLHMYKIQIPGRC